MKVTYLCRPRNTSSLHNAPNFRLLLKVAVNGIRLSSQGHDESGSHAQRGLVHEGRPLSVADNNNNDDNNNDK